MPELIPYYVPPPGPLYDASSLPFIEAWPGSGYVRGGLYDCGGWGLDRDRGLHRLLTFPQGFHIPLSKLFIATNNNTGSDITVLKTTLFIWPFIKAEKSV